MADAILFDIDGTLIDSVDLHAEAWQKAFHHFGHDIPFADIRKQIGKGGDQLLPVFLDEQEREQIGKELEKFRGELFKRKYLCGVKSFPSVRELFEKVLANGQEVAIASSAKPDELESYERIAGIEDLVHVETTSGDVEKSKPYPDIFEAAFDRLKKKVSKDQVIVVGDSPHDAEAARGAGIRAVGVLCGGFPEEDLRAAGCIAVYADPADLLRNYDASPLAR